jgi:hypothetical protein
MHGADILLAFLLTALTIYILTVAVSWARDRITPNT